MKRLAPRLKENPTMINLDTLLSTFTEKGTLLKWLQKLEKALGESTLENVTVTQDGEKVTFNFNFADKTTISTPQITLPRGANGAAGVGVQKFVGGIPTVNEEFTVTPIEITLTDGTKQTFNVSAANGEDGVGITDIVAGSPINQGAQTRTDLSIYKTNSEEPIIASVYAYNGENGENGNGIVSIHTLSHRTEGEEEITTVEVVMDENTQQFEVHAQNGSGGAEPLYAYDLYVTVSGYNGPDMYSIEGTIVSYISKQNYTVGKSIWADIINSLEAGGQIHLMISCPTKIRQNSVSQQYPVGYAVIGAGKPSAGVTNFLGWLAYIKGDGQDLTLVNANLTLTGTPSVIVLGKRII